MTYTTWGIKYAYTDREGYIHTGLLGSLYFCHKGPKGLGGYLTATFPTRALAREAAERAGRGYDRATAVRVEVSVVEAQG